MSDYFDHVERELRTAVRGHAHLRWYVRLRLRHSRALVVILASLIIVGPALAAVSLLPSGSSVGPNVPRTPNAFNGVALHAGVRMLSLRTADPVGGPRWGMRLVRTTRGLLCMQVGRVAFGTIGALGADDAFHNDGRFHRFSPNYQPGPAFACATPDGRGNGFLDVAAIGVPASAFFAETARAGGCIPAQSPPKSQAAAVTATLKNAHALRRHRLPACPARDLRDIYYGLLGPDAVSVTHVTSSGGLATTPTIGADGAYLIVLTDHGTTSQNGTSTSGSSPFAGAIRAVHYRDGRSCRLPAPGRRVEIGQGSCRVIGYVPAAVHRPTEAQVASAMTTRIESAKRYCEKGFSDLVVPCLGRVPAGFKRIDMSHGPAQTLVQVSFLSHVAITNSHSYYYIQMSRAPYQDPRYPTGLSCNPGSSDFGQTNSDYAAGQRVTFSMFENLSCRGPVHGDVSLVIDTGPAAPAPMPAVKGQSIGREVGHFTIDIP
jgi:hypothetical protein